NVVVSNRFYDGRNLLQYESVPHKLALKVPGQFASSDWSYTANPYTSYTYDSLKRPLTRKQPDSTSTFTWTYAGFITATVDENGHQKSSTTDALGRLANVKEYTGTNPYTLLNTTTYGYDLQDRLTT